MDQMVRAKYQILSSLFDVRRAQDEENFECMLASSPFRIYLDRQNANFAAWFEINSAYLRLTGNALKSTLTTTQQTGGECNKSMGGERLRSTRLQR